MLMLCAVCCGRAGPQSMCSAEQAVLLIRSPEGRCESARIHACLWPCLSGPGVRHRRPPVCAADATPHLRCLVTTCFVCSCAACALFPWRHQVHTQEAGAHGRCWCEAVLALWSVLHAGGCVCGAPICILRYCLPLWICRCGTRLSACETGSSASWPRHSSPTKPS